MNYLGHDTLEAIVPNVINENASPKNTTILMLKQIYFEDVFKNINKYNYRFNIEKIANELILKFEETAFEMGTDSNIEEIEIVTPLEIAKNTNSVNGSLYGYMLKGYDNSINRIISYDDELDAGFSFVGSSSLLGSGFDNSFYSGYLVSERLLKEVDHE